MLTSDSGVMSFVNYTTELCPKHPTVIMTDSINRYTFFIAYLLI